MWHVGTELYQQGIKYLCSLQAYATPQISANGSVAGKLQIGLDGYVASAL